MATLINRIPSLNGTSHSKPGKAPGKRAKASRPVAPAPIPQQPSKPSKMPSTARQRAYITAAMGVWIPLFSLGLSHTGGKLLQAGSWQCGGLGVLALALMGCVLAVSLSHLAWAVEDITHSPGWASWLLAITFDLALVHGELVHVYADQAGVGGMVTGIMVIVCGFSMGLNCWAFFKHPGAIKRGGK